jgi:hypothetical protein
MTTAIASSPSADHGRFTEKHHDLVVKDIKDEAEGTSEDNGAKKGKKKTTESVQEKKRGKGKSRRKRSGWKRRDRQSWRWKNGTG